MHHQDDWKLRRLRLGAYKHCITVRCEQACVGCGHCGSASDGPTPPGGWDRAPAGSPGTDQRVIRLHGGDALRHGDLAAWVGWASANPRAWIEVEGPAGSLAADDAALLVDRVAGAGVHGVNLVLHTIRAERTAALAGRAYEPARALDAAARLLGRGRAVSVILPVHAGTAPDLDETILAVAERLGDGAAIVLRRVEAPALGGARRLPVAGEPVRWPELDPLSRAIERLPSLLPRGSRLHLDAESGYAPCMLSPGARRQDLSPARPDAAPRPQEILGETCAACSWRIRCTYRGAPPFPPAAQLRPLDDDEARTLQEDNLDPLASHKPRPATSRPDRRARRLPEILCVAPWTSMSATELWLHPVPCAMSWVKNNVVAEEAARALGIPTEEMQRLQRKAAVHPLRGTYHCVDNEGLSMHALWNNPLLRVMRHQMLQGGPTRHCRSMCRTVMGVEDRGADLLARADHELTPAIVANRELLLEELRAGRTELSARPLELVMGVASHCNITCGFCHGPGGTQGELTDARREEIKIWLPTLMSFGVVGPGEPLMSRNYLALLAHIADGDFPALRVALTTNGTLLTPAFLERHRRVPWAHVRVSLNAGSEATHRRMTGKELFGRVMENLEALVKLRDAQDPPFEITLSCVLSEMVMGDLHNFAELATTLRTHIVVEPMYGDLGKLSPWTRPEKLHPLADELDAVSRDFSVRNPPLAKAFRAVEQFARERLERGVKDILQHH